MGTHIIWGEKFCIAFFPLVKVKAIYNINIEPVLYNFKAILKSYMVIIFHINVATYLIYFFKSQGIQKEATFCFYSIYKNYMQIAEYLENTEKLGRKKPKSP